MLAAKKAFIVIYFVLTLLVAVSTSISDEEFAAFAKELEKKLSAMESDAGMTRIEESVSRELEKVPRVPLLGGALLAEHKASEAAVVSIFKKGQNYVRKVARIIGEEASNSSLQYVPCSSVDGRAWSDIDISFDEANLPVVKSSEVSLNRLTMTIGSMLSTDEHGVHIASDAQLYTRDGAIAVCRSKNAIETAGAEIRVDDDWQAFNYIYFGHYSGVTRWWPGLYWRSSDMAANYDARERPWYVGALAVPRTFILMLDVSSTTSNEALVGDGRTRLEDSVDGIIALINTLDSRSSVAIVLFNETITTSPLTSTGAAPAMNPRNKKALKTFLRSSAVSGGSSNIASAMDKAGEISSLSQADSSCETLFILITDGVPTLSEQVRSSSALVNRASLLLSNSSIPARMHVVSIGPGRDDRLLRSLSCAGQGVRVQLNKGESLKSAVLSLQSSDKSFSPPDNVEAFMNGSVSDDTTLTSLYLDALGTGLLVSVTKPVYKSDGTVYGVAALDVSLAYISEAMQESKRSLISTQFIVNRVGSVAYYPLAHFDSGAASFEDSTVLALETQRLAPSGVALLKRTIEDMMIEITNSNAPKSTIVAERSVAFDRITPLFAWEGQRRGLVVSPGNFTLIGTPFQVNTANGSADALFFFSLFDPLEVEDSLEWSENTQVFNCSLFSSTFIYAGLLSSPYPSVPSSPSYSSTAKRSDTWQISPKKVGKQNSGVGGKNKYEGASKHDNVGGLGWDAGVKEHKTAATAYAEGQCSISSFLSSALVTLMPDVSVAQGVYGVTVFHRFSSGVITIARSSYDMESSLTMCSNSGISSTTAALFQSCTYGAISSACAWKGRRLIGASKEDGSFSTFLAHTDESEHIMWGLQVDLLAVVVYAAKRLQASLNTTSSNEDNGDVYLLSADGIILSSTLTLSTGERVGEGQHIVEDNDFRDVYAEEDGSATTTSSTGTETTTVDTRTRGKCIGRALVECGLLRAVNVSQIVDIESNKCDGNNAFRAGGLYFAFVLRPNVVETCGSLKVYNMNETSSIVLVDPLRVLGDACTSAAEDVEPPVYYLSEDPLLKVPEGFCQKYNRASEEVLDTTLRLETASSCAASTRETNLLLLLLLGIFVFGVLFVASRHARIVSVPRATKVKPFESDSRMSMSSDADRGGKVSLMKALFMRLKRTSRMRVFWEETSELISREQLKTLQPLSEGDRDEMILSLVIDRVDKEIDSAFEKAVQGSGKLKGISFDQDSPKHTLAALSTPRKEGGTWNGVLPGQHSSDDLHALSAVPLPQVRSNSEIGVGGSPKGGRHVSLQQRAVDPRKNLKKRGTFIEMTRDVQHLHSVRDELVRVFLHNAIQGAPPRTRGLYGIRLRLYWVQKSTLYRVILSLAVMLQLALLFFEAPSSSMPTPNLHSSRMLGQLLTPEYVVFGLLVIETICTSLTLIDLILSVINYSFRCFCGSVFGGVHFTAVLLLCIDVVLAWFFGCSAGMVESGTGDLTRGFGCAVGWNGYPRWSRVLRPILILNLSSGVREEMVKLIRVMPKLFDVSILLAYTLAIFALFFTSIFASRVQSSPFGIPDFDSFSESMSTLYVFISGPGTFSRVVGVTGGERGLIMLVLAMYVIGALYLFSNITAVTLDAYGEVSREMQMRKIVMHRKCLFAAFRIFTKGREGTKRNKDDMGKDDWEQIVRTIQPSTDALDAAALFELADEDLSGSISPLEFVEIFDVLRSKKVITSYSRWELFLKKFSAASRATMSRNSKFLNLAGKVQSSIQKVISSPIYSEIVVLSIILYGIVLVLDLELSGETDVRGISLSLQTRTTLLSIAQTALVTWMVLELFLHLLGSGLRRFATDTVVLFDLIVLFCAIVSLVPFGESGLFGGFLYSDQVTEELFLVRQTVEMFVSLRTLKLILTIGRYQRFLRASYYAIPGVMRTVAVMLMLFYIFVVLAMEFLAGRYRSLDTDRPDFNSAGEAFILTWQLLVGAEWGDAMREAERGIGRGIRVMFILFNLLAAKILLNVLVSVFFRSFERVKQIEKLNKKREECRLELQKIKERHRQERRASQLSKEARSDEKRNSVTTEDISEGGVGVGKLLESKVEGETSLAASPRVPLHSPSAGSGGDIEMGERKSDLLVNVSVTPADGVVVGSKTSTILVARKRSTEGDGFLSGSDSLTPPSGAVGEPSAHTVAGQHDRSRKLSAGTTDPSPVPPSPASREPSSNEVSHSSGEERK
uniref:Calmodulin n=1 Tax=Palpitomonas bilix TaxID=652834 RepID=A0A7S3D800_9EUKA|mmetsp:Transcript_26199/g.66615  ORF Transcript_26199/g.66615 Transcript_26199/m.66615 type:complete len:2217 (+) Transcript_26199:164-6814(+)